MNRVLLNIVLVFLLVALGSAGCANQSIPQKTVTPQETLSLNDDFSKYRPKVELIERSMESEEDVLIQNEAIESPYDLDARLQAITDSMVSRQDTIRMIEGFTILVYSGNNELLANRTRNELFDIIPDLEPQFSYKLPTYFVKIGQFYQQIEAQPLLKKVKAHYPTSSIVPEKFPIKP